ncbi:Flp pilus assembly protein CpaB [Marinivivus vitaminiproducens]|uniref:Flp pilus assembly protein CpaB n=1 Tax=Marinivivus vitaminiproducens TaxID=3035935 RepID=UPI00279F1848|nr:Flp pilus assembly protein CpaB [Geminicoccaceae bacterium SCSIO 64248]
MNTRVIVLAVFAIGAGAGTVGLVTSWMGGQQAELDRIRAEAQALQQGDGPVRPVLHVLVAAAELPAGHVLQPGDLRWQAWPEDTLDPAYRVQGQAEADDMVGAVVRSRVTPGEPLTASRVTMPGERGYLAAILTPGMRAIPVPIDAAKGVAGLVKPGDRVDLVLTHAIRRDQNGLTVERAVSETTLRDIRVLAIDQRFDDRVNETGLGATATLEVTPKDVEAISVMLSLGAVSLSLRSAGHPGGEGGAPELASATSGRSYTLDSDVSYLLNPPIATPPDGAKPRPILVFRAGQIEEVSR